MKTFMYLQNKYYDNMTRHCLPMPSNTKPSNHSHTSIRYSSGYNEYAPSANINKIGFHNLNAEKCSLFLHHFA